MTGALVRAILIMILVAMPSVLLPGITADTRQVVALVALFAGALTFVEYNATYPSLLEFRDAAPFNRMRFLAFGLIVFTLSVMASASDSPSPFARLFEAVGFLIGAAFDFPYSPVWLTGFMISAEATPVQLMQLRSMAGTAYALSLISVLFFVLILRLTGWPSRDQVFNVWVNLPTFEPTAGGDVVGRLERDARLNLILGFLLPFITPMVVALIANGFDPERLTSPQTLIWTMSIWAFLPANLLMRGVGMARVAAMIRSKRKENAARAIEAKAEAKGLAPA